MRIFLPPHLTFCEADGRFIFLDRRQARYFLLAPHLEPAVRAASQAGAGRPIKASIAHALVEAAVASGTPGRPFAPTEYEPPHSSLLDQPLPRVSATHFCTLMIKEAVVRHSIWRGGLDGQFRVLETLGAPQPPAVCRAREALVAAAEAMRFARSVHAQCLPRSLVLAHALRRRGDSARLVLGVNGSPFAAHAWVQAGDLVLNDELDRVRLFAPILTV